MDNGSEFADHDTVAQAVTAAIYFCAPHCSGQRGTNENTNGLIRQYFPKGTDFQQVTDVELRRVVKNLNDRPRKRLGYRTPAQVFLGSTQEPWIPQVLLLLLEFRTKPTPTRHKASSKPTSPLKYALSKR